MEIPNSFSVATRNGSHIGLKITDGDTIQINQPIRMLNIDTPEKEGGSFGKADTVQKKLNLAKKRIKDGHFDGLINDGLKEFLVNKITNDAAERHFRAGKNATNALSKAMRTRIGSFSDDLQPRLFVQAYDPFFDKYLRVLALVAPWFLKKELPHRDDPRRRTYNLELLEDGHAASFPIYPSIPKNDDWLKAINASKYAWENKKGQWDEKSGGENVLLAYEFRAVLDLSLPRVVAKRGSTTRKYFEEDINQGQEIVELKNGLVADGWEVSENDYLQMVSEAFSRHCVDITSRKIVGKQDYYKIPPWARLWVWDDNLVEAKEKLKLN